MGFWLLKSEPDVYSYDDLVRDKKTVWDGVANNAALKHMREIRVGDLAFIYHTGDEKAVVGIAQVVKAAYPDPQLDDPKALVIDLKPQAKLKNPVGLKTIKADSLFEGSDLVRQARLSVMPMPQKLWDRILKLSEITP